MAVALLLALCVLIYLADLGRMPLWDPDEPRYAEMAWEMLESGDFVTSRFDGVRYLKKPPLLFWMTAGSFAVLGKCEFAARLPSALSGIAGAVVCYVLARSMFGALAGLLAGGVLATSLLPCALGRIVRFDAPLTLFVSLALLLFWLGHREPDRRRSGRFFIAMYPAAALAMLVKGPVGPGLVALIIFVYLLVTRNLRLIARMRVPLGLLAFAAIAAPWFVLAEGANPGLAKAFFLGENVSRFASGTGGHEKPVWYYLLVLLVGMLPWTGFVPGSIWVAVRDRRTGDRAQANAAVFCLIWIGVVLGFFTLSGSRMLAYVLPAWPALAALTARLLAGLARQEGSGEGSGRVFAASTAAAPAVVVAMGVWGTVFIRGGSVVPPDQVGPLIAAFLAAAAAACALTVWAAVWSRRPGALLLMTAGMGGLTLAICLGTASIGSERSLKPLSLQAKAELGPGDLLVSYEYLRGVPNLCFYTGHPVIIVGDPPGEFDFDRDGAQRDEIWLPEHSEILRLLRSRRRVLVFTSEIGHEELRRAHGELRVVGERNGKVLLQGGAAQPDTTRP